MNEDSSKNDDSGGAPVRTRSFRKWQPGPTLTPEQARRQSDVLRHAHRSLPRDTTVAFLNTYNQQLEGVPLHLALASDEGLLGVEQLLLEMKATTKPNGRLGAAE